MTSINQTLGPAWTYRILGFICFACALNTCVWVKERVPQKRERKKFNEIIQFGVLRNKNYLLFIIAANLALFGNFIPYFYLPCKIFG
jgi:predicted MFS family arabinose efflux permease